MNFHLKDGLAVEFAAYEGNMIKITKAEALTSITSYMTHIAVLRLAHDEVTQIRTFNTK